MCSKEKEDNQETRNKELFEDLLLKYGDILQFILEISKDDPDFISKAIITTKILPSKKIKILSKIILVVSIILNVVYFLDIFVLKFEWSVLFHVTVFFQVLFFISLNYSWDTEKIVKKFLMQSSWDRDDFNYFVNYDNFNGNRQYFLRKYFVIILYLFGICFTFFIYLPFYTFVILTSEIIIKRHNLRGNKIVFLFIFEKYFKSKYKIINDLNLEALKCFLEFLNFLFKTEINRKIKNEDEFFLNLSTYVKEKEFELEEFIKNLFQDPLSIIHSLNIKLKRNKFEILKNWQSFISIITGLIAIFQFFFLFT